MTQAKTRFRCAIYTRKSTEEGLDQQFNSLDAQRAACEAYVLSQAGEGWEALPDLYDDGGWSGGNMERPAIKRLLEDIRQGRIDIVVVYKVDRLTRSLMDFARIVETFDAHEASFVSVTQSFNTTNSMGRLTLNVLLSFAQFEREVTGERIRDKIAASKARGIFMGGNIPLGYDLGDRVLLINEAEAQTVRHMYTRYLELRSVVTLAEELDRAGIRSKRWTSRKGTQLGGLRFTCGALAHILNNRLYLGEVTHQGKIYDGEHKAIIEPELFDKVQAQLQAHRIRRASRKDRAAACPLTGKLFDQDGNAMRPTFGYGRGRKIYRYYVSEVLLPNGRIGHAHNAAGERISAERLERLIVDRLQSLLPDGAASADIVPAIERVEYNPQRLTIDLDARGLGTRDIDLLEAQATMIDPKATLDGDRLTLKIDARAVKFGKTLKAKGHLVDQSHRKSVFADIVRTAHRKLNELNASPLNLEVHSQMTVPINEWSRQRIAVGLLAPDIQKALLLGNVPKGLEPELLLSGDLPLDWEAQLSLVLGIH